MLLRASCVKVRRDEVLDALRGRYLSPPVHIPLAEVATSFYLEESDVVFGFWLSPDDSYGSNSRQPGLPDFFVVRNGELRNFFAWFSTYIPQLTPVTQWARVFEEYQISHLGLNSDIRIGSLAALWAAVSIGECLVNLGGRGFSK